MKEQVGGSVGIIMCFMLIQYGVAEANLKTALLTVLCDDALVRLIDADSYEAHDVVVLQIPHLATSK